jgi:hypothetical protein
MCSDSGAGVRLAAREGQATAAKTTPPNRPKIEGRMSLTPVDYLVGATLSATGEFQINNFPSWIQVLPKFSAFEPDNVRGRSFGVVLHRAILRRHAWQLPGCPS